MENTHHCLYTASELPFEIILDIPGYKTSRCHSSRYHPRLLLVQGLGCIYIYSFKKQNVYKSAQKRREEPKKQMGTNADKQPISRMLWLQKTENPRGVSGQAIEPCQYPWLRTLHVRCACHPHEIRCHTMHHLSSNQKAKAFPKNPFDVIWLQIWAVFRFQNFPAAAQMHRKIVPFPMPCNFGSARCTFEAWAWMSVIKLSCNKVSCKHKCYTNLAREQEKQTLDQTSSFIASGSQYLDPKEASETALKFPYSRTHCIAISSSQAFKAWASSSGWLNLVSLANNDSQ